MGQALYRKHRPKKLSEVVGQGHVTETLKQALRQGRISHAYLFTGPRGVGKTSIARILAHEINNLPYEDDSPHIDIIEIDAASNRRIDEIRELRDKVHVAPASARYKVYIIDEVHMLTKEAFNALLKTLEEPPAHVVFILATTDAHKLPETIVSRTQRFAFKPVEKSKVRDHLESIAKQEKIKISPEALTLLAEHGEGSFRDSISLLDQASGHSEKLTAGDVYNLLGIPPAQGVERLYELLGSVEAAPLVQALQDLYDQGFQPAAIAGRLGQALRRRLIYGDLALPADEALDLLGRLIEVPAAHNPERFLEILLLQTINHNPAAANNRTTVPKTATQEPAAVAKPKTIGNAAFDEALWPELLQALKQRHNTLHGVVRMARPDFSDPEALKLTFAFAFHEKKINENGNREILMDIVKQLTGLSIRIECVLDKNSAPIVTAASKAEPLQGLSTISNIFGGAELLES